MIRSKFEAWRDAEKRGSWTLRPASEAKVLKTIFRSTAICTGLGLCLAVSANLALADPVYSVNMTFQSGATFQGDMTLSSGYNYVESVSGTLYGYSPTSYAYSPGKTDPITWIWTDYGAYPIGYNYSTTGGSVFGTFLMDGSSSYFYNWIEFTYNYSGSPNIVFAPNASLNDPLYPAIYPADGVNNNDPGVSAADLLVAGSITLQADPPPTPEPSTLSLLLLAFVALGTTALARRRSLGRTAAR